MVLEIGLKLLKAGEGFGKLMSVPELGVSCVKGVDRGVHVIIVPQILTLDDAVRIGFRPIRMLIETDLKTSIRRKTWLLYKGAQILRITQSGKSLTNSYQETVSGTHHG